MFRLLLLAVAAAAAVIEKRTTQKAIEQAQQGSGRVATSESTIVNEVNLPGTEGSRTRAPLAAGKD